MRLRQWSEHRRRRLAVTAGGVALLVISCRFFVWSGTGVWNLLLWLVQGAAMLTTWLAWRSLKPPRDPRGVDMKAKRLHW